MEDRRRFLDLEMYKISEEDSQDEEVSGGGEVERKGGGAPQETEEAEEEKTDGSRLFKLVLLEEEDANGARSTGSSSANYDNLLGREEEIMEEDLNEVALSMLWNQIPEHLFNAVAILFTTSVKVNKKTGRTSHRSKRDAGKSGGPGAREQRSGIDRIKESEVDVVFCWPKKTKSKTVQGLVASQGMFVTLFKALKDVTGAHPIASQVDMDGQITNISYASDNEGKSLLLVAVAERIPGNENSSGGGLSEGCVTRFTSRLTEAILFKWGSLTRAFLTANEKEMGRFLANGMAALLNGHPDDFLLFNQPRAYPVVPKNVMVKVEQILLDFESSDFCEEFRKAPRGHAEGCNDGNKDFHCLGSILLYKGELISSHLEAQVQGAFYTWMMTELNKWGRSVEWPRLKKMAVWQPAFLKGRDFEGKDEKALSRSCHYVVLVGLDYFLLGFVLEPIASCCDKFLPPDVRWIRRGLGALIQLVRSDVYTFFSSDVPEPVEMVQLSNSIKPTAIGRLKGKGGQGNHEEKVGNLRPSSGGGMSSKQAGAPGALEDGKSPATPRPSANIQSLIDEFEASHIEGKRTPERHEPAGSDSGPYVGGSDASSSRLSGDGSDTASIDRSSNYFHSFHDSVNPVSITKGNLLYQFVHLHAGLGVMVSPRSQPVQEDSNLQEEIMKNFRKAALVTHELLQRAAVAKKTLAKEEKDWKWASKTLSNLVESGTLFELNISDGAGPRKKKKTICYWVVGRLCENDQEIYVCMKDSVEQQSCLETAFKIAQVMHAG